MVGDNIEVMKNPFLPSRGEPIGIGGTDTLEEERLAPTDEGDHERFSHYVRKEKITEAMVSGKWVPSRDPEKFPICPTCKEIYDGLKKE